MKKHHITNQKGVTPIVLFLIAFVGVISYVLISGTFDFQDRIFNQLFQKPATQAAPMTFITRSGARLYQDGQPWRFAGTNMNWLGLHSGSTVSRVPSQYEIEDGILAAKAQGLNVIRTHGFYSTACSICIMPSLGVINDGTGGKPNAFEPLDYAIKVAKDNNMRLMGLFVDNHHFARGGKHDFTEWRGLTNEDLFYTDATVKQDFKNYITAVLNHVNPHTGLAYKDEPAIFAWETGNEMGASTSWTYDAWTREIAQHIKSLAPNQLVSDGRCCAGGGATDYTTSQLNIPEVDMYSRHLYPIPYTGTDPIDPAQITRNSLKAAQAGKVSFIGEWDWTNSNFETLMSTMENDANNAGSLYWILFPHNETNGNMNNNTKYSLHFPDTNGALAITPANAPAGDRSLAIRNHAYKMRGINPIPSAALTTSPKLYPISGTNNNISVNWQGVAGAASYIIERSDNGGTTWQSVRTGITDYQSPWIDTTGTTSSVYRIKGVNVDGVAGASSPEIVTLNPEVDTYTNSASPSTPGTGTPLWVSGTSSQNRKAFLRFNLAPFAGRTVTAASLSIRPTNTSALPLNVKYFNDDAWTEAGLIHTAIPSAASFDATPVAVITCNALAYCTNPLNLTRLQSKMGQKYSVMIEQPGTGDDLNFSSMEDPTNKPQLILTLAGATPTPSPSASVTPTATPTPTPAPKTATMTLSPSVSSLQVGQQVSVQIVTRTDTEFATLFNASLNFNPALLEVVSIARTGSFITNWVEEFYDNVTGDLNIIGGYPDPGYKTTGTNALLTTVNFRAKSAGTAAIAFDAAASVLRNSPINENILQTPTGINLTLTATPAPTASPTPTATPVTTPTPTITPTATPTPTVTPTNTPSPTQVPLTACAITSAIWDTSQTLVNSGLTVQLKVNATGDCTGKSVVFEIREDDGLLGYDLVEKNPTAALLNVVDSINRTFVTTASWTTEFQLDGFFGVGNPPEYKYVANIQGSSTLVTSNTPMLQVNAATSQGSLVNGDVNQDGAADLRDIARLYSNWNINQNLPDQLDPNNDGALNTFDVEIIRNLLRQNGVLRSR